MAGRPRRRERLGLPPAPGANGRWPDFQPGNEHGNRHEAYALVKLAPEAQRTAELIRELVPLEHSADEPTIQLLAVTLKQVERAVAALDKAKPGELARLSQDAQGWVNRALACADALGMSPRSRARLGLDLARAYELRREDGELDLSLLSEDERRQLETLAKKAERAT